MQIRGEENAILDRSTEFPSPKFVDNAADTEPPPSTDPATSTTTAEETVEALRDMLGATDNVSAQAQRFGDFPTIETPSDANISVVTIDARENVIRKLAFSSVIEFYSDAPMADLVTLYSSEAERLGWKTDSISETTDYFKRADLKFEIPPSADGGPEIFEVTIKRNDNDILAEVTLSYRA